MMCQDHYRQVSHDCDCGSDHYQMLCIEGIGNCNVCMYVCMYVNLYMNLYMIHFYYAQNETFIIFPNQEFYTCGNTYLFTI